MFAIRALAIESNGSCYRANSKRATALAYPCKTFSPHSWYHAFFMQTVLAPRSGVAGRLHDLLQGLLHSVPIVRLCGNGQ